MRPGSKQLIRLGPSNVGAKIKAGEFRVTGELVEVMNSKLAKKNVKFANTVHITYVPAENVGRQCRYVKHGENDKHETVRRN